MKNLARIILLFMSISVFNAHGAYAAPEPKPPLGLSALPFRQNNFDYRLAWKTSQTADGVAIEGKMKNIRSLTVVSLEMTVFLRGKDGRVRSRVTVLPMPQYSKRYDVVDFSLLLKGAELLPGDLLEFVIHYSAQDGSRGLDWRSTFSADARTGAPMGKERPLPAEW